MGVTQALTVGAANYTIMNSRRPIFRDRYGITDSERINRLMTLFQLGGCLKCVIAPISDIFPIFGYSKRWYCFGSALLGGAFGFAYCLLPKNSSSANSAAAFLFLTTFCKHNVDILCQGMYSRRIRYSPSAGPEMVSWVWWAIFLGDFITLMQGKLSDQGKPEVGVIIASILQILPAFLFLFNKWTFREETNAVERRIDAIKDAQDGNITVKLQPAAAQLYHYVQDKNRKKAGRHTAPTQEPMGEVILNEPITAEQELEEKEAAIELEEQPTEVAALSGGKLLRIQHKNNMPQEVEEEVERSPIPINFQTIHAIRCGQIPILECNGFVAKRHWRLLILCGILAACAIVLTVVNLLGTTWQLLWAHIAVFCAIIIGAYAILPRLIAGCCVAIYLVFALYLKFPGELDRFYLLNKCGRKSPQLDYTFYYTIGYLIMYIAGMFATIAFTPIFSHRRFQFTFIFTTCLQVIASLIDIIIIERWNIAIGIPDKATWICGFEIIYETVHVMHFMPTMILMSRIVPRGSESILFSIAAGYSFLGQTMANTMGSILLGLAFKPKGCDFTNIRNLVIVGHMCLPLLQIPLAFLLLPHCRICDDIDIHGNVKKAKKKGNDPNKVAKNSTWEKAK
ncbi:pteridine transporter [Angomonas deanei]|nr:pteridine transporter [Angomonas deanei]|eukprot:EPY17404.1 pteridine transporter [Angomonas deanei]